LRLEERESRYNVKRAPRERRGRRGSAASVVFSIVVDSFDSSSDSEKPRENFFKNNVDSPLFYAANRKKFFCSTENFFKKSRRREKIGANGAKSEGGGASATFVGSGRVVFCSGRGEKNWLWLRRIFRLF